MALVGTFPILMWTVLLYVLLQVNRIAPDTTTRTLATVAALLVGGFASGAPAAVAIHLRKHREDLLPGRLQKLWTMKRKEDERCRGKGKEPFHGSLRRLYHAPLLRHATVDDAHEGEGPRGFGGGMAYTFGLDIPPDLWGWWHTSPT